MVSGINIYAVLAITGVVLGAGYILWMLRRVFYGPPRDEYNGVPDADLMERVYIYVFVAVIMLIGLYPRIFTDVIKLGVQPILGGV
jgi:NADH-quinone oxidoreductase subunit M